MQKAMWQKPNWCKKEGRLFKGRKEKPTDFLVVMKFVLDLLYSRGKAGNGDLLAEVVLQAHVTREKHAALCVSGFNKQIRLRFL